VHVVGDGLSSNFAPGVVRPVAGRVHSAAVFDAAATQEALMTVFGLDAPLRRLAGTNGAFWAEVLKGADTVAMGASLRTLWGDRYQAALYAQTTTRPDRIDVAPADDPAEREIAGDAFFVLGHYDEEDLARPRSILHGGEGNDTLDGGMGDDTLFGGPGIDTLSFEGVERPVDVDLVLGAASGQGTDSVAGFEHVVGSTDDDSLRGNWLDNLLDGAYGSDTLPGGQGSDTLVAFGGRDSRPVARAPTRSASSPPATASPSSPTSPPAPTGSKRAAAPSACRRGPSARSISAAPTCRTSCSRPSSRCSSTTAPPGTCDSTWTATVRAPAWQLRLSPARRPWWRAISRSRPGSGAKPGGSANSR
jgi:hypothetical protein